MPLKIIFCGTPEFSVPTLQALIHSEHEIIAVYTPPDRPAGRGQKLMPSPIKRLAEQNKIPVHQPKSLRDAEEQKILENLSPDLMVVVAYGLILPPEVLSIPKYGCMNVHASLLPKWRGAAPIQRAILSGDKITGVTIMQMDKGLDTGDMLLKRTCEINISDTSEILHERLSILGAEALIDVLSQLEKKALSPEKQSDSESTYATKIQKTDAKINWDDTSENIHNLIRAFNPWPVAFTNFNGQAMRIWSAKIAEETPKSAPGTLIAIDKTTLEIATRNGTIKIQEIQLPGGKRQKAADFINSHRQQLIPMQTRFN